MHQSPATVSYASSPTPSPPADRADTDPAPSGQRFRGDIQGLRAVAVLAVLGFHAGVPFMPGGFVGVDVFFVISGFLITGLIHREVDRTGGLSLWRFWARRVRRLLPATAVVLGAVAVMTIVVLPVTRWSSTAWDIGASALYVVNWRFADQSVNYLVSEDAPSPVQHFWSLAVEEQFYLVWPVLILGLLWLRRRYRLRLTVVLLGGIAAIGLPSLAWSVYLTETSPGQAYFVSTTRLWELAIGAALAIVAHRLARMPVAWAHLLGALGLAAIVFATVRFDGSTPFPGLAALVPTLGAAAVIAAGTGRRAVAGLVLDTAPMRDIGTISYSLYLWHWPLLVAAAVLWGGDDGTPPLATNVLVVGFAAVPAWLTYRIVEAPFHHARVLTRRPGWAMALGVTCTVAGVAAALIVSLSVPKPPVYASSASAPGAAVLDDEPAGDPDGEPVDAVDVMVPGVLEAPDDIAELDGEPCISDITGSELESCTYGPADAEVTVAVVGDSKMHQWLSAIQRIADERDWQIVTYLKSACPLAAVEIEYEGEPNAWCSEYNEARLERLRTDESIDFVITSQVSSFAFADAPKDERTEAMADDLHGIWQTLEDAGRDVIVMIDNPNPQRDVMECVATHEDDLGECAFPRDSAEQVGGAPAQLAALGRSEGVASIDVRDYICPGDACPAVIGNTLVYRRGSHLTATYVESLTPLLDAAIAGAMH